MKICAYCGRENPDDALACRECGQPDFEAGAQPSPNAAPGVTTCDRCNATTQIPGIFKSTRKYLEEARKLDPGCFLLERTEQKLNAIAATVTSLTPPASPDNS